MGLDTYAARSEKDIALSDEDIAAFEAADIQLCGGLFSGDAGSFRGKVYNDLVEQITGESLYQFWIPPEVVQRMAQALASCDAEEEIARYDMDADQPLVVGEIHNLRRFFQVCAARGLGLIAIL
jgi:hypothetical protein